MDGTGAEADSFYPNLRWQIGGDSRLDGGGEERQQVE